MELLIKTLKENENFGDNHGYNILWYLDVGLNFPFTASETMELCATHLAGGLLLKILNYFKVTLNIFEFSRAWENVETWLVYANKFFWIVQPFFSTDIIK